MRGAPRLLCVVLSFTAGLIISNVAAAQASSETGAINVSPMKLVSYSGKIPDGAVPDSRGVSVITFAIYRDENGGNPLWQETQEVTVDASRKYTVHLGATAAGLPSDLFPSDQPRWLGVQPQGQPEQPRAQVVSVPYAIKAGEADTLAGHPASDFVTTQGLQAVVQQQVQQQLTVASAGPAIANGSASGAAMQSGSPNLATTFIGTTGDEIVEVQQDGTGVAINASAVSNSAIVGVTNTRVPAGVIAGVEGVSSLDSSFGVYGAATSRSSSHPGIGVHGQSDSPNGIGVEAIATGTGNTIGMIAQSKSPTGFAIDATETATSGNTVGLLARVSSPAGIGALIFNGASGSVTGSLISARTNQGVQFSVDGRGNVNALGSLTSSSVVQGTQLISTAGPGTPPFQINSTTAVPNLNSSLLGGLSSGGFIQNSLTPQTNTNFNIDGKGTVGGSVIIGSNPSVNGQIAFIRDDQDYIHSIVGEAGQQMHLRVSSAQPGPGGAKDFLIAPYTYGMALEYAGVLEAWVDDFSVHTNHRFEGLNTPARFWVGDEDDLGGLFATAMWNSGPPSSTVSVAADSFYHTSHGTLQFQVRNQNDGFKWQWGAYGSEVTRASLTNSTTATNLNLTFGSVQGIFAADSANGGAVTLGSASATPVSLLAGNSAIANLFPDGNMSIGNAQDSARLSVGSAGLFSVSDAGAVAAASMTANSIAATSLNTGSLTLSGPLSATDISASGTVTANALNTGAVTASSVTANSLTTPSLSATSAMTTTLNSNSSNTSSLTLGGGAAIVGHLSVVSSTTFTAIAGNSCETQTALVPGASDGDTVALGIPNVLGSVDGVSWFAWVSTDGVVSIRGCNATTIPTIAPPAASIRVDVWKH